MPELVLPDVRYHRSVLDAMAEDPDQFAGWLAPSRTVLVRPEAFEGYVGGLLADRRPETPRLVGFVPQTVLWWVDGDELLARVGIRHELNHRLRTVGGHIGYWTRPTRRREGHATAMLRAALPWAAQLGIDPALVTCDEDNRGSRAIIESSGGVFEQQLGVKRLYWVPTAG